MSSIKWSSGNWVIVLAASTITLIYIMSKIISVWKYNNKLFDCYIKPAAWNFWFPLLTKHRKTDDVFPIWHHTYICSVTFSCDKTIIAGWYKAHLRHALSVLVFKKCLYIHPVASKTQRAEDGFYDCHWHYRPSTPPLCHSPITWGFTWGKNDPFCRKIHVRLFSDLVWSRVTVFSPNWS